MEVCTENLFGELGLFFDDEPKEAVMRGVFHDNH